MQNLIENCPEPSDSFKENGFFVRDRKYYVLNFKGDKVFENEISNFVMKIVFHLKNGTQNTKRLVLLQRHTGEVSSVEVSSSDLKPDPFETILKSNRCTFYGTSYQFKRVISYLMDNEEEATFINLLGWDSIHNVFAFADHIYANNKLYSINKMGIVKTDDNSFYLPAFSEQNIENEDYDKERLYAFKPGNLTFETWAQLMYDAFGINGAIGIQFLILCAFRDFIFNSLQFFPFMFLFGDFGTGKTSYTENLLHAFGKDVIGTPLNNATSVALSRIVGQFKNGISYLKEFTNETDESIQDFILTVYDGSGRATGIKSNDNKTKAFPVHSGLIFDGNFLPSQKTAILSRMILLVFESQTYTDKQVLAFNELRDNSEFGFGRVLTDILDTRDKFTRLFQSAFKKIVRELKQVMGARFTERTIKHIGLLLTPVAILNSELETPFTYDELKDKLIEFAKNQDQILKQNDAVTIFWRAFDWGLSKFEIRPGEQYQLRELVNGNGEIAIKIQKIYPVYLSFCKANKIRDTDISSLRMLLCSSNNKEFIPSAQQSRGVAWTIKGFGSAHKFKYTKYQNDTILINDVEISLKPYQPRTPM
ncbi:MAG: hypothetical protein N4A71_02400 [Carboxylicivirga sp.]|jgi:hypothetical protein|nr:hypothetical protein [Carboxylicivirga sp.]